MLDQGGGRVSLVLAEYTDSNVPCVPESLAKGGREAATKSLTIEHASRGIVRTPIVSTKTIEAMAHLQPLGQVAEVEDIVRGVLYLEMSPLVTGELLHIDGGRSAA